MEHSLGNLQEGKVELFKTKKPLIFNSIRGLWLNQLILHQVLLQSFMRNHSSTWIFPPTSIFQRLIHQRHSLGHEHPALEWLACLKGSQPLLASSPIQLLFAHWLGWHFAIEERNLAFTRTNALICLPRIPLYPNRSHFLLRPGHAGADGTQSSGNTRRGLQTASAFFTSRFSFHRGPPFQEYTRSDIAPERVSL